MADRDALINALAGPSTADVLARMSERDRYAGSFTPKMLPDIANLIQQHRGGSVGEQPRDILSGIDPLRGTFLEGAMPYAQNALGRGMSAAQEFSPEAAALAMFLGPRAQRTVAGSSLVRRIENLPQAPMREVLPSDLPIQRPTPDHWQILDAFGDIGLNAHIDPAAHALRITGSGLPDAQRGQGVGIAMYQRMIDEAHKNGYKVHSDYSVSPDAQRIYEALAQRGYGVERNPRAFSADNGALLVPRPSREPIFVVHPPERAPE